METLIESGRVVVNGKVATIGTRVGSADQIKVAGRLIRTKGREKLPRVLKPLLEAAVLDKLRGACRALGRPDAGAQVIQAVIDA